MSDSIVITDRIARSRARRRRTALMVRIFVLGLLGAVIIGWTSGAVVALTRIKHVTVQSSDPLLAQEVSQSLRLPPDTNLVTSRLGHLAREIERLPRVKSVEFKRRFPDQLAFIVVPRQAAFAFRKDGRYLLVDREGVCISWTRQPAKELLRVEGMAVKADVGQRIAGEWFDTSCIVLDALSGAERFRPWVLDVHNPPELSIIAGSGARGIVGQDRKELNRRTRIFVEALEQFEAQGKRLGLMELRTERPIVWAEEHRPDRPGGTSRSPSSARAIQASHSQG